MHLKYQDASSGTQRGRLSPVHPWCPEHQLRLVQACKVADVHVIGGVLDRGAIGFHSHLAVDLV